MPSTSLINFVSLIIRNCLLTFDMQLFVSLDAMILAENDHSMNFDKVFKFNHWLLYFKLYLSVLSGLNPIAESQ